MSTGRSLSLPAVMLLVGLFASTTRADAQSVPPPRWQGTIDRTIGGADADDDATFGRISGLAVDATGRVFVADAQDLQIRVFSPTGALVARLGRSGSGPLEFKRLGPIGFGPDRLLWARDEGNARMLGIDVSVTPVVGQKNVPLQSFTGGSRLPITFESDGSIVDETIWFDQSMGSFRPLRVRRSASGAIARSDTLAVPPGAFAGVHKVTRAQKDAKGNQVGTSQRYYWQPFGPQWMRAYGPGGVRADAVTSRYEVHLYDASGKRVRTITRAVAPVALSAKERTKADGRQREADVYDASGRWIAVAEWPRAIDMYSGHPFMIGNSATTVAADSDGVERVVRLRFG